MADEWKLVFHLKAKKLLKEFQTDELDRIEEALEKLSLMELEELDIKKLEGLKDPYNRDVFRVKVSRDIRILVSFDPENKHVHVWRIARRESVYDV